MKGILKYKNKLMNFPRPNVREVSKIIKEIYHLGRLDGERIKNYKLKNKKQ